MDAIISKAVLIFVLVISLCGLSTGDWAGRQWEDELPAAVTDYSGLDSLEIDENMAQLLWIHCRLELVQINEAIKSFGITFPEEISTEYIEVSQEARSLAKHHLQKAINSLPLQMKEILLDCLSRLNDSHFPVSSKENNGFQSWFLRYLETLLRWHPPKRRELAGQVFFKSKELFSVPVPAPAPGPTVGLPNHSPVPSGPSPASSLSPSPAEAPEENRSFPPGMLNSVVQPPTAKSSETPDFAPPFLLPNKHDGGNSKRTVAIAVVVTAVGTFLFAAFFFYCCNKCIRKNTGLSDEHKDGRPLLASSFSDFSIGSSPKTFTLGNSVDKDKFESLPPKSIQKVTGRTPSLEVNPMLVESKSVKLTSLPLPPAAKVAVLEAASPSGESPIEKGKAPPRPPSSPMSINNPTPPPPGPPPPPPPAPSGVKPGPRGPPPPPAPSGVKPGPRGPPPPPPPKAGPLPPRPPPVLKVNQPSPPGRNHETGQGSGMGEPEASKPKLKPFFWDKVLANPDHSMVWHQIKSGSFQFNEEMIETLFGYNNSGDKGKGDHKKETPSIDNANQFVQIIDPKKSQNLSILLRASNVTTEEVCDALLDGNELPAELLQTFLKMSPTADEELKLRLYKGELSQLLPAERFLKVLTEIPYAFKRMEALLYMTTFQEEVCAVKESFATLEVASSELRSSRLFLKLLEAVLKTGNRMNDGTFRGGAQAFKLDTLLKLADVKGADGKTTLLHFVVQEIIRSEGIRRARTLHESTSTSSLNSEELTEDSPRESTDQYRTLGLQVVSGLSGELENVKKAAILDPDDLTGTVLNLGEGLASLKEFLNKVIESLEEESGFRRSLESFVKHAEGDVTWLFEEEKRIRALVKSTTDYFHGNAAKDEGLRLFVIVRNFLVMIDKVCTEVKESQKKATKAFRDREAPVVSPVPDPRKRLFPAIKDRRMGSSSSSSDEEN